MDITKIDPNFSIKRVSEGLDIDYYDVKETPIKLFGVFCENNKFVRMPERVAKTVSEGVHSLYDNTAGGRICFKTDSRYIVLAAKIVSAGKMPHFTTLGSAGFDLYIKDDYFGAFMPDYNIDGAYNCVLDFGFEEMREITINFPLYSSVSDVYVGVTAGAKVEEYYPYKKILPIVYYGSSITQGGCASRPGNSYQAEICRRTGVDYINLGFSGNAKGEQEMADYIADLNMSIFVMDYDHNTPNVEHLKNTHEKFFKTIRKKNKDLPVIFVTKPDFKGVGDSLRRDVIYTTYRNALLTGDENVAFIDGSTFFSGDKRSFCTVDNCHPNDMGFYQMACSIGEVVEKLLKYGNYVK